MDNKNSITFDQTKSFQPDITPTPYVPQTNPPTYYPVETKPMAINDDYHHHSDPNAPVPKST